MMHKAWCNIEEVPYNFSGSSIKLWGHTGWKIDVSNPIWVRLLGRSQLSNPSDLPCYWKIGKYAHACSIICPRVPQVPSFAQYMPWWRHQMETFSALLAICVGNSPVPGEFPTQRPVTRSFDVYFDLPPNKLLSKQSLGWWFETLSPPLWRHRNAYYWLRVSCACSI